MRWFLIALASLLLTGCFGDESDSRGRSSAAFAEQVNGICHESNVRLNALGERPKGGTPRYVEYIRETQAIGRDASTKLDQLRAPRDLDPLLRKWVNEIDTLSRHTEAVGRATARVKADIRSNRLSGPGPEADSEALSKAENAVLASTERLDRLSRRAGLTECVRQN